MTQRRLIFRVEVLEADESGTRSLCSHSEFYMDPFFFQHQDELIQYAYEAFDQARNKFCGSANPPS